MDEQRLLLGVEEDVAQPVPADPQSRREGRREGVGGENVQVAALDEGGDRQLGDKARSSRLNPYCDARVPREPSALRDEVWCRVGLSLDPP